MPVYPAGDITSTIIPFPSNDMKSMAIAHATSSYVGFILTILILLAIIQTKKKAQHYLIISLCLADLLICGTVGITSGIHAVNGGWSSGSSGCIIDAVLVLSGCGVSMMTLVTLSLDKYVLIICAQSRNKYIRALKPLTVSQAIALSIAIWISISGYACLAIFLNKQGHSFSLQSSNIQCAWSWWETTDLFVVFGDVITCLVVIGGGVFIVFTYYSIISFVIEVQRRGKKDMDPLSLASVDNNPLSATPGPPPPPPPKAATSEEKRFIMSGLVISIGFFTCWFPYLINVLIQMSLRRPVTEGAEAFASLAVTFSAIFNPLILTVFDLRVQKAMLAMLGMKELPRWLQITDKRKKTGHSNSRAHKVMSMTSVQGRPVSNLPQGSGNQPPVTPLTPTRPDGLLMKAFKRVFNEGGSQT